MGLLVYPVITAASNLAIAGQQVHPDKVTNITVLEGTADEVAVASAITAGVIKLAGLVQGRSASTAAVTRGTSTAGKTLGTLLTDPTYGVYGQADGVGGYIPFGGALIQNNVSGNVLSTLSQALNVQSIAADTTVTFSGAPASSPQFFYWRLTTDGTARTVTLPASVYSEKRQATVSTMLVPASSTVMIEFQWTGSQYVMRGDPQPVTYTWSSKPSAAAAGTGAIISIHDNTYRIYQQFQSNGTMWLPVSGVVTFRDPDFRMVGCNVTIGTGSSGHLTFATALPVAYTSGLWVWWGAAAAGTTPAVPSGWYWVVMTTTTVGTLFTAGPGSSAFNFSVGGSITQVTGSGNAQNLIGYGQVAPTATGIQIPGGLVGPNGTIHATRDWHTVNNANTKTNGLRYAGTTIYNASMTTNVTRQDRSFVKNINNAAVNWIGGSLADGTNNNAPVMATINTSNDINVTSADYNNTAATDYVIQGMLLIQVFPAP